MFLIPGWPATVCPCSPSSPQGDHDNHLRIQYLLFQRTLFQPSPSPSQEEVVTTEIIDDICAQLTQMALKVQKFKCDGDEFDAAAAKFADLSSILRLSYNRIHHGTKQNCNRKQRKAPRQGSLLPFLGKHVGRCTVGQVNCK
jgi:hypothetical protein